MKQYAILIYALIAAIGNAFFAFGQKKATVNNSLLFVGLSAIVCIILTFLFIPFFEKDIKTLQLIKTNWPWILISGIGLFLTYIGFNLLYGNFGASAYIFYAVLSIITTSVIVGIIIFKEKINIYHIISMILAIATIILFTYGNKIAKG
ncbi:MAG: transporter [Spirochaetia bacterium]|nr:transporter [Spirochaetia bacterium]